MNSIKHSSWQVSNRCMFRHRVPPSGRLPQHKTTNPTHWSTDWSPPHYDITLLDYTKLTRKALRWRNMQQFDTCRHIRFTLFYRIVLSAFISWYGEAKRNSYTMRYSPAASPQGRSSGTCHRHTAHTNAAASSTPQSSIITNVHRGYEGPIPGITTALRHLQCPASGCHSGNF